MFFLFFSSLPAASLQKAGCSYYKNVSNAVHLDTQLAVLSVYTLSYALFFFYQKYNLVRLLLAFAWGFCLKTGLPLAQFKKEQIDLGTVWYREVGVMAVVVVVVGCGTGVSSQSKLDLL